MKRRRPFPSVFPPLVLGGAVWLASMFSKKKKLKKFGETRTVSLYPVPVVKPSREPHCLPSSSFLLHSCWRPATYVILVARVLHPTLQMKQMTKEIQRIRGAEAQMGGEEGGRPSRGPLALCPSNPRGLAVGRRSNGATPTAALERETRSQFVVDRQKNRVKIAVANASDRHPSKHCMYMLVLELAVGSMELRRQVQHRESDT